jgi:diadenosine tetraphosphate (Ap4A) HIT family hydrolase
MTMYYLGNARTAEQLADMRDLEAAGVCIFCPEHLAADPNQRVLHRTAEWTVTPNEFPYRNTRLHLLLVPNEHVTDLADLSPAAQQDFWNALRWVRDHFGLTFYGMAVRNGLSEYTGGTVRHVHVHIIQGDVENPDHQPVRTRLSSKPEVDPDELDPGRPEHGVAVQ